MLVGYGVALTVSPPPDGLRTFSRIAAGIMQAVCERESVCVCVCVCVLDLCECARI